ncbi:MAG TPA: MarR family transcriptional regulator [Propionibacteriaceae bacterium]|nr:MarR family transcriptional regulator [Propionibacteriaceae bacterium]
MTGSPPVAELRETLEAIREVVTAAEQYRDALAGHFGLGRTEAQAVGQLAATDGLGQTELAARLGITTGATTALIDRLESAGIARRAAHPSDRRRSVVTLTDQGHAVVKQGQDSLNRLFIGIEEEDLAPLARALMTIAANMTHEIRQLSS